MDVAQDGGQARCRPGTARPLLAKALADVAGQGLQQAGLAAEAVGRQATAVAGRLAHLGQGHAQRAALGDDGQGGVEHAAFGFFPPLRMAAARWPDGRAPGRRSGGLRGDTRCHLARRHSGLMPADSATFLKRWYSRNWNSPSSLGPISSPVDGSEAW